MEDGSTSEGPASSLQPTREDPTVLEEIDRQGIEPEPGAILDEDPVKMSWQRATRYILRVRSNVMLIVASALGYFFYTGLETFALIYLKGHYAINQGEATLVVVVVGGAAVLGAILGGRFADSLVDRGKIDGRLIVAAAAYLVTALTMAPAVVSSLLAVSLPLFLVAGFAVAAPNPGLDAARLDIMPSRMWGRAEGVRSLLRTLLQAFAPLLFGLTSELFGGKSQGLSAGAQSSSTANTSAAHAAGLEPTFLIMLAPLLAAGIIVWWGRRFYPGDVAAAAASEERFPPQ